MRCFSSNLLLFYTFLLLILVQHSQVLCYQYKVGDLDAWGIPTAANPDVYTKWSRNHAFKVGDSLLFLYPPSQDSLIQVKPEAYKTCNLKNAILTMNDGNSVFNITQPGEFYFTSGEESHCLKGQKLQISLSGDGAVVYAPDGPPGLSDTAASPGYTPAFGSIPTASSSSSSRFRLSFFVVFASLVGSALWVLI